MTSNIINTIRTNEPQFNHENSINPASNIEGPRIRPLEAALIQIPELDLGQSAVNLQANMNAGGMKRVSFFYKNPQDLILKTFLEIVTK
jgi:hypothetical protein